MILLNLNPTWLYDAVHELVRMAFPGQDISREDIDGAGVVVDIKAEVDENNVNIQIRVTSALGTSHAMDDLVLRGTERDRVRQVKMGVRSLCYQVLTHHLGREINAYGILTGMRPVKLVHKMLDQGCDHTELLRRLQAEYLMRDTKARLLLEVATNNRPFLSQPPAINKRVGVYIGIPYCPSRCIYCSFPGAVLKGRPGEMDEFLKALKFEMQTVGDCLQQLGYQVETIYLGGGTPAVLSVAQTERLFSLLMGKYIFPATTEITVEAGRPDTLSEEKLKVYKKLGVTRVCINPQSMNDSTLKRIGRNHDREGVLRAVEWVRNSGIKQINMDLIVGLPGEGLRENTYTAEEILKLSPENITVHTLALKRGSLMAGCRGDLTADARVGEVEQGVELFAEVLRQSGYEPYYLYRQKYMQASMENIGYSLPGQYCQYNIQMIEERQTILGLGGGGASKFVNARDFNLTSVYNPRDPQSYCKSVDTLTRRKVDKLLALN